MPEHRKNGDAPSEKSAARKASAEAAGAPDAEVAKATTGQQLVSPQAIHDLLREGSWLHVKFLEAKRGNSGLFGARPYPIGSANEDKEARNRDLEAFGQETREAVAWAANVPTVRIDSLSDLDACLDAFLRELMEIDQWQAFQDTAGSFANSAGCATSAGADLFRPYDASPLVRIVAEILDELPGDEKPNIPFGKFIAGDAVRVIKTVIRWLRSEVSRQDGALSIKTAEGDQQEAEESTSKASTDSSPAVSHLDAWGTHLDIAKTYGTEPEIVRKRLDRWRGRNSGSKDWRETEGKPKYLYRLSAIKHLFDRS